MKYTQELCGLSVVRAYQEQLGRAIVEDLYVAETMGGRIDQSTLQYTNGQQIHLNRSKPARDKAHHIREFQASHPSNRMLKSFLNKNLSKVIFGRY